MSASVQQLAAAVSQALQRGDRDTFVRSVKSLLAARAPLTSGWKSLSQPLLHFGEFELARSAIDLFAAAQPGNATAAYDRALVYAQTGKPREALAVLDRTPSVGTHPAATAYLRGTIALNLGDASAARAALIDAHRLQPGSGQILQTISMLGSLDDDEPLATLILDAEVSMRSANAEDRAAYLYALGKLWDDRGNTARAYASIAAGAALVASVRRYDVEGDRQHAKAAVSEWTGDRIDAIAGRVRMPTDRAIIVTGLPRSGSTLVEQILVSHSAVVDGDEVARFGVVVDAIGGTSYRHMADWTLRHNPTDASRTYLHLLAQRFGRMGRVVDKTLDASRYLGLLASIAPQAPLLWMRRDPLDVAWSCFSTWFLTGLPWSWSQQALAEHIRLEEELLERWQDILGDRLMVVDYEALVADKHARIPPLLAHVGLDVEPDVFSPERTERLVTTASLTQVRAPINNRAIGRGRRYADHLRPFVDSYRVLGGSIDE
ncbi:tetratricopeptide (TPR) repeat protein [Sphingomonas jinjuensis]|uniref:Tetratricopeptide (TPR) repeat protein n=1 Tax=Sphingomonas jinjuensis TaxID=535907 RepID=A0A840F8P7_9SPHN|nr:sulfotransferase [Sphingomonas jinjuensis]MBB4152666.1 tetratricopeptide (TPR) repeat protein [Sphingomonas jinjuensis]